MNYLLMNFYIGRTIMKVLSVKEEHQQWIHFRKLLYICG